MSQILLVLLSRPESAADLLDAARIMAGHIEESKIEVLPVRCKPEALILPSDETISAEHLALLVEQEKARVEKLRHAFQAWPEAKSATWIDDESAAPVALARVQAAELLIIERPEHPMNDLTRQTSNLAIFDSHRPVLVVPPGGAKNFGRHLAVAWRDDDHAVKALLPALRYFARADVSVLVGGGADWDAPLPPPVAETHPRAKAHRVSAKSGSLGKALLAAAKAHKADMLVMGAYGHSAFRELLFGGVTRDVLAHADLPVLMRH